MTLPLTESFDSSSGAVRWGRLGDDQAPPLVLLHGTPWSSFTWRAIADALAGRFRVYFWDMPGYGASAKFDGQDVSFAAQGKVFVDLLGHWGLDRPVVVAHDMGGAVALRAHLLHGAQYEALALVDPVALTPSGSPFYLLVNEHADVFAQLPRRLHRALVAEYISSASHPGLHPATLDGLLAPWLSREGQPAFYRQIAQADDRYLEEIQHRYPDIDIPVLVVWGTDDEWIPVQRAHKLVEAIPGVGLRLIPGAGHLVQEDAPAQLTEALLGFLGGYGARHEIRRTAY